MTEQIIGDIIGISSIVILAALLYICMPEDRPRPPKIRKPDEPIHPTFL